MTTSLGSFCRQVVELEELEQLVKGLLVKGLREPGQKRIATGIIMISEQNSSEDLQPVKFVHEPSGVVVELDLAGILNHIINAQENA